MTRPRPRPVRAVPLILTAALLAVLALGAAALLRPTAPTALPATALPATGTLSLTVEGAQAVATPPGVTDTSVFMTLRNRTDQAAHLNAVSSPDAASSMLMQTRRDAQGRVGMSGADTLTVPAHGTLILNPAGDHVMLMGLKRPAPDGSALALTLTDEAGRTLSFTVPVVKPQ